MCRRTRSGGYRRAARVRRSRHVGAGCLAVRAPASRTIDREVQRGPRIRRDGSVRPRDPGLRRLCRAGRHGSRAVRRCRDISRYASEVLFLETWSDIYTRDVERTMSFDEAGSFGEALRDVYTRSGYTLIEVPGRGSTIGLPSFVLSCSDVRGRAQGFDSIAVLARIDLDRLHHPDDLGSILGRCVCVDRGVDH